MKSNYHERKQARLDNAKRLSEKNVKEQEQFFKRSDDLASMIPPGQPILIGHHSEKRHRSHLKKVHNLMNKGLEAGRKADYYANKAEAIEHNTSISSDDPDAITLLEEKLSDLEKVQQRYKACNKIIKNKKLSEDEKITMLLEQDLSEGVARKLLLPDFCGRIGYPAYKLQNNNANITRTRQRLESLKVLASRTTKTELINNVRIVSNVEANRLQIIFPEKPEENVRKELKRSGFRWSPTEGAWQRHLSREADYQAKKIINDLSGA